MYRIFSKLRRYWPLFDDRYLLFQLCWLALDPCSKNLRLLKRIWKISWLYPRSLYTSSLLWTGCTRDSNNTAISHASPKESLRNMGITWIENWMAIGQHQLTVRWSRLSAGAYPVLILQPPYIHNPNNLPLHPISQALLWTAVFDTTYSKTRTSCRNVVLDFIYRRWDPTNNSFQGYVGRFRPVGDIYDHQIQSWPPGMLLIERT